MLKRVMSALVVSGVMLSGAAFAADQPATGSQAQPQAQPQPQQTQVQAAPKSTPASKQASLKAHKRIAHTATSKTEQSAKAEKSSVQPSTTGTAAGKTN